jgi:uncharacterized surface protein with fasciclin (FAS1) repeats
MNYFSSKCRVLLLSTFALFFVACEKQLEEGGGAVSISITDQIATNSSFSILNVALVKAGMEEMLDTPGTFTFFAPNNAVMIASGFTLDRIQQLSGDSLRKILSYHLLKTRLFEQDFKMGVYYNEITAGGDSSYALRNEQGLFINGIKMLFTDFLQSNGLIHIPSKVFHFPQGDLLEVVAADTSLSLFNAALLKSAKGGTNLTNALVCGCKFTIFAPTNEAFKLAGYPDLSSIEAADYKKIVALLSYHITKERVFSSDLIQHMNMQMIDGRLVQVVQNGNSYMLKGEHNKMPVPIIKQNTMAVHGLVHVIDRLLE